MSHCARRGLLEMLLRVAASLAFTVTCTLSCRNYQSPTIAGDLFGVGLTSDTEGYKLILTADPARNEGCYTFKFKDDNTFTMDYKDDNYMERMHTGNFAFEPRSFQSPGFLDLGLPPFTLGAGLFGGSRLNIIYVATDLSYFVTISCGFLNREHVHVFGKTSSVAQITTIKQLAISDEIPQADQFREVDQVCTGGAVIVPLPARHQLPRYSISLPSPTNPPFTSHNGVPSQFVYSEIGNPVSTVGTGQVQQYYLYNPALPAVSFISSSAHQPPYSGLQNGSPRANNVPSNVKDSLSVGQHYVTATRSPPYFSSPTKVAYGSTALHYP